jgi:hypothetical protein
MCSVCSGSGKLDPGQSVYQIQGAFGVVGTVCLLLTVFSLNVPFRVLMTLVGSVAMFLELRAFRIRK